MTPLTIYQVYFNEQSKKNCFPEWNHYNNEGKLTEYFENSVIVDLIDSGAHKDSRYFGVFSHDIKKEIHFKCTISPEIKYHFYPQNLEKIITVHYPDIDVFGFQKRRQNPNIVLQAERYHPGFVKAIEKILSETGFLPSIPKKINSIILFNHFIMRSEIYEQYVNELLRPAMEVMKSMPELFEDARYHTQELPVHGKAMPDNWREVFKKSFGVPHYPYHPFICERLPSLFMEKYKYSFKHIF